MKTNKVLLATLITLIVILSSCKSNEESQKTGKKKHVTITGEFTVADPTPVKLYYLGSSDSKLIDSIQVSGTNFKFDRPIEFPGIYLLRYFNDQRIYLILKPGDNIAIQIDNSLPEISYYVENSSESKRVKKLMDKHDFAMHQIDQLSNEFKTHVGDTAVRKRIDAAYMDILRDLKEFTETFIYEEPTSLANLLAIHLNMGKDQPLFDRYDDFKLFRFVDSCLVISYPAAEPVHFLNKDVTELKLEIANRKYIQKIVEAGRPVPSMITTDIHGDTIVLSESPEDPVLLYFWASWNPYSVEELLQLDRYLQKLPPGKLQVLSVSLDSRKTELDRFISEHKLSMPVICDYQYWNSELTARYAVKQIPSSIVSNAEGMIIAKDVFGNELYQYLDKLVKE
ncbi:MAG: AhpC/TSA family protein [Bacteroidales bacterium]|nr:AhpC/TSA family protein [Bacteroidales bacterium]